MGGGAERHRGRAGPRLGFGRIVVTPLFHRQLRSPTPPRFGLPHSEARLLAHMQASALLLPTSKNTFRDGGNSEPRRKKLSYYSTTASMLRTLAKFSMLGATSYRRGHQAYLLA
jgi:hypothetical protein